MLCIECTYACVCVCVHLCVYVYWKDSHPNPLKAHAVTNALSQCLQRLGLLNCMWIKLRDVRVRNAAACVGHVFEVCRAWACLLLVFRVVGRLADRQTGIAARRDVTGKMRRVDRQMDATDAETFMKRPM